MAHIFISYSKKNRDYAYQLADYLEANGFPIWIDRADIEYGVDWWDAIVEGLRVCGAFIVIMTPESKASQWVKREVFLAEQQRKSTFPILLNGDNWELFVLTQYADLRNGAMPGAEFLQRLSQHVTPRRKGEATVPPPLPIVTPAAPTPVEVSFDVDEAIIAFNVAYRAKQWSEALNLLGRIRASRQDPSPFDPDDAERRVQTIIEDEKRRREREAWEGERAKRYRRVQATEQMGDSAATWAALQRFWQDFPEYDPEHIAEQVRPKPSRPSSLSILRQGLLSFDWIAIPGKGYSIAKYPLTNAQFKLFMDARGYQNQQWWTAAGWEARARGWVYDGGWKETGNAWVQPRSWTDAKWNGAEQPVVGVSWYEAVAYCLWLSDLTGEQIMLPTEDQWQYAAQGEDGRQYPWGNDWDCKKCNNSVKPCNNDRTTSVRQYEGKGDSPFGVVDMAGNVWEWCLTDYEDRTNDIHSAANKRGLRGGSWLNLNTDLFRCGVRVRSTPHGRDDDGGFRLALSS
ncbi:MAG: SUMF1/EgtB/PvdO family nonheme iron enzyme [Anaerolineae bacterium]|nr:SUMF1/EgtB/PvdO family nonheme iron enzyme [Anaerolineae bacterium]